MSDARLGDSKQMKNQGGSEGGEGGGHLLDSREVEGIHAFLQISDLDVVWMSVPSPMRGFLIGSDNIC